MLCTSQNTYGQQKPKASDKEHKYLEWSVKKFKGEKN